MTYRRQTHLKASISLVSYTLVESSVFSVVSCVCVCVCVCSDESSQDSGWTAGSLSAQSSQEEVPEVMLLSASDGSRQQHCVMELGAALNRTQPHQYR